MDRRMLSLPSERVMSRVGRSSRPAGQRRGVEVGPFAGEGRGRHPIGGGIDFAEVGELGGGKVGEGLGYRKEDGGGRGVDGDRGAKRVNSSGAGI